MRFVEAESPTQAEILVWAYAGDPAPIEDWYVVVADLENLDLLLELAGDPHCPTRQVFLASLYCLVGHCDRDDPRLMAGVHGAETSPDPWLQVWTRRVRQVVDDPSSFVHKDWCGGAFVEQPDG